jgi:hypothetical protein
MIEIRIAGTCNCRKPEIRSEKEDVAVSKTAAWTENQALMMMLMHLSTPAGLMDTYKLSHSRTWFKG